MLTDQVISPDRNAETLKGPPPHAVGVFLQRTSRSTPHFHRDLLAPKCSLASLLRAIAFG